MNKVFTPGYYGLIFEIVQHLNYDEIIAICEARDIMIVCTTNQKLVKLLTEKYQQKIKEKTDLWVLNYSPDLIDNHTTSGDPEIDSELVRRGVDLSHIDQYILIFASENGHLDIVHKLLWDLRVDPSANNNEAIRLASKNGHLSIVGKLLQDSRVDPTTNDNEAIRLASKNGHLAIVNRLLQDPRVSPDTKNNEAIRLAHQMGHTKVVRRLLQDARVDPNRIDDV